MVAVVLGIAACQKPDEIYNEGDTYNILVLNGEDIFEVGEDGTLTDFGFNLVPIGTGSNSGKGVVSTKNVWNLKNSKKASSARATSTFPIADFITPPDNITIRRISTGQERTIPWNTSIAVPKGEDFTVLAFESNSEGNVYSDDLPYMVADQNFHVDQNGGNSQHYEIKATTRYSLFTVNNNSDTASLTFTSFIPTLVKTSGGNVADMPAATGTSEDYYKFTRNNESIDLNVNFEAIYTDSEGATHTITGIQTATVSNTEAYEHYQYNFNLQVDESFNNNVNTNDPTDVTFTIILDQVFNNDGSVELLATYTAVVQTYSEENSEGDFAYNFEYSHDQGANKYYISTTPGFEGLYLILNSSGTWSVRDIDLTGGSFIYYLIDGTPVNSYGADDYMTRDEAEEAAKLVVG